MSSPEDLTAYRYMAAKLLAAGHAYRSVPEAWVRETRDAVGCSTYEAVRAKRRHDLEFMAVDAEDLSELRAVVMEIIADKY